MLKVRLSTSPHVRHPAVLERDFRPAGDLMYGFAPVGLLSLIATVREKLGTTPELFDLNRRIADGSVQPGPGFYDDLAEQLAADSPDVVGLMTECDSYHHVLQICEALARRCDARIVLGGPHATAVARETLAIAPAIDAIVLGEGERSFVDLLQAYAAGSTAPISGVLRRDADGNPAGGMDAPLIDDLDDLPIPAYDLYVPDPGEEIFLEVGRGCPFKCAFCSTAPFWRRRHRVKSPARILEEVQLVVSLYGPRRVHFTHDLFTTDRKWVLAVCRALIDAGVPVRWTCSARTDLVDDILLAKMAEAGCNAIYFGIESGSARILEAIRKDVPIEQSLWALERCAAHGIAPNAGFILGFAEDAEDSARDTFDAYVRAIEIGCKPTHIFGYCPFAASAMYPALETLRSTGHFLDLPLGEELDGANRAYVASRPELFASYFRPANSRLWAIADGFVEGVDEFSPLVEAATWPALVLARQLGGMFDVYRRWLGWVGSANQQRGASRFRRWYGSPAMFCRFLAEALRNEGAAEALAAADVAQIFEVGFNLADTQQSGPPPTTMATHRTVRAAASLESINLSVTVRRNEVGQILAVDHDVVPALEWRPGQPDPAFEVRPTYFAWKASKAGDIALISIDQTTHALLADLEAGPRSAAELIALWSTDREKACDAHVAGIAAPITRAAEAGLVVVD